MFFCFFHIEIVSTFAVYPLICLLNNRVLKEYEIVILLHSILHTPATRLPTTSNQITMSQQLLSRINDCVGYYSIKEGHELNKMDKIDYGLQIYFRTCLGTKFDFYDRGTFQKFCNDNEVTDELLTNAVEDDKEHDAILTLFPDYLEELYINKTKSLLLTSGYIRKEKKDFPNVLISIVSNSYYYMEPKVSNNMKKRPITNIFYVIQHLYQKPFIRINSFDEIKNKSCIFKNDKMIYLKNEDLLVNFTTYL